MGLFRTLFGRWNERQVPAGGDVGKMVVGGGGGRNAMQRTAFIFQYFRLATFKNSYQEQSAEGRGQKQNT